MGLPSMATSRTETGQVSVWLASRMAKVMSAVGGSGCCAHAGTRYAESRRSSAARGAQPVAWEASTHGSSPGLNCTAFWFTSARGTLT
jgi:hypothetical protein